MKKMISCLLVSLILTMFFTSASADSINKYSNTTNKITFTIDKSGTYSVVVADFEGNRLQKIETITNTLSKGTHTVTSKLSLSSGDKIMLWDDLYGMTALCAAYTVNISNIEGDSGIFG